MIKLLCSYTPRGSTTWFSESVKRKEVVQQTAYRTFLKQLINPWSGFLPDKLTGPLLVKNISPGLLKPEGSSPHSQEHVILPYPELDQSSPCLPSHFFKINFNIILPYTPGSFKRSVFLRFPTKTLYASLLCYMPCPSYSSSFDVWIISCVEYRA